MTLRKANCWQVVVHSILQNKLIIMNSLPSQSAALSIATINCANLGEWTDDVRLYNFTRSIVEDLQSPMIVAVQELGGLHKANESVVHAAVADDICRTLKENYQQNYQYVEIAPPPESSGGAEEINIRCGFFYRAPIELLALAQIGIDLSVFIGDDDENVPSRLPLQARFKLAGHEFHVINCHLKSMSTKDQTKKQAKKQRNKQASAIACHIIENDLLSLPLFVVGDMNDTFSSKTVQAMASHNLESAHMTLHYQIYTYKYHKKPILLDYILYNERVKNLDSKIIHVNTDQGSEYVYSDHDPLLMICRIC